jgi:hypothetical protein
MPCIASSVSDSPRGWSALCRSPSIRFRQRTRTVRFGLKLFNGPLLRRRAASVDISDAVVEHATKVIGKWVWSLQNSDLAKTKEVSVQGPFLAKIFGECLGYDQLGGGTDIHHMVASYCQDLWMRLFQATSVSGDLSGSVGVMSRGRSRSFPLWKTAPARTRATRCGALTARQRV